MINIYTIETIILLHNMNVLKLFNEHYPVYIVPTSYSILSTYFSKEYQKVYGSVGTRSIMSIREYINKELDIDINCLKMVDLPYISKDEVEKKARNMYSHKKWSHEIVYIEHFMANKDNDYRLIIDTKSGLSSETSNTEYILYHHAISIFGVLKEMSEQLNISNDDLNKIYTYLSQNNHTSMTKLSEYFSHDEDYRTLFRQR